MGKQGYIIFFVLLFNFDLHDCNAVMPQHGSKLPGGLSFFLAKHLAKSEKVPNRNIIYHNLQLSKARATT